METPAGDHPYPLYALMLWAAERAESDFFYDLELDGFPGLTRSNWQVFANVPPQGTRPTEIARLLAIRTQSVSTLVRDLERLGYVERLSDPMDARVNLIRVSKRGRRLREEADKHLKEMEAAWARDLGAEDLALLRGSLEKLRTTWRATAEETWGIGQYGLT